MPTATPLTDACVTKRKDPDVNVWFETVPAHFARDLERENAKLREQIEEKEIAMSALRKLGTVYVYPSEWDCASEGGTPPIEAFDKYDVSQLP